jgi:hypothetical protein
MTSEDSGPPKLELVSEQDILFRLMPERHDGVGEVTAAGAWQAVSMPDLGAERYAFLAVITIFA